MVELNRADLAALLAALSDASIRVRTAALRALVRLPLAPDMRTEMDTRITELLRKPPAGDTFDDLTVDGFPFKEVIDAAIFCQSEAPYAALRDLLSSNNPNVRKAAARALSRARDPNAIDELFKELDEEQDPEKRADAAQFLSLHDNIAYEDWLNTKFNVEKDPFVRLWLALAIARLGQIGPLMQIEGNLRDGRIDWKDLQHDYDLQIKVPEKLSPYGAFPEKVTGYLQKNWGIIFRNPDFGYTASSQESAEAEKQRRMQDRAYARQALLEIQQWYRETAGAPLDLSLDTIALEQLSPALASKLVSEYFRTYDRTQIGFDRKIDFIVQNLPEPFVPDLPALFQTYLVICRTFNAGKKRNARWKIAWFISRAGIRDVIQFVSPHLKPPAPEDERVAAAKLVEDIARLFGQAVPPVFGGAPTISDVPATDRRVMLMRYKPAIKAGFATLPPDAREKLIDIHPRLISVDKSPVAGARDTVGEFLLTDEASGKVKASDTRGKLFSDDDLILTNAARAPEKPIKKQRKGKQGRVVNTLMREIETPDAQRDPKLPLKPGTEYYFCLGIGRPVQDSLEATPVGLPDLPAKAQLMVVLFSYSNGFQIKPGGDTGELIVYGNGSVEVLHQPLESLGLVPDSKNKKKWLFFRICAPETEGDHLLRCNIYHKQLLLQSRLIRARVGGLPDKNKALVSELDYTISRSLDAGHISGFSEHRMSVMLNENGDGTRSFFFCASDGNTSIRKKIDMDIENYKTASLAVRNTLKLASWGSKEDWNSEWNSTIAEHYKYHDGVRDPERLQEDLINMATWGSTLYYIIIKDEETRDKLKTLLAKPGLIQIAMKNNPKYYFPAGCVYDQKIVTEDGRPVSLCPRFADALKKGENLENSDCFKGPCKILQESEKDEQTKGKIVCPFGFWGFRHCVTMPLSVNDADAPTRIPVQDIVKIPVAVSEDLELYGKHIASLKTLGQPGLKTEWENADNFQTLIALLKQSPHLVYFYCHGGAVRAGADDQDPFLSMGPKDKQFQLFKRTICMQDIVWQNPQPLVFMNGCHTAAIDPGTMINLVEPLLIDARGAGVIGTEITIFENMATIFAEECLRRFLNGDPIGWAIRGARLKVLAGGNPLALAYIPFVAADLKLVKT